MITFYVPLAQRSCISDNKTCYATTIANVMCMYVGTQQLIYVCCILQVIYMNIYVGVTELLMAPSKHPGCSGTRNLHDNISDLRAQVAANQKV